MAKHENTFAAQQNSKPAYLYARFSSQGQREGHSIERQLTHGREFAGQHGWTVVEHLTDEAKSAFKGANREVGAELYEFERRAREGHFQNGAVLVCENVDRLSRQGAKAAARLIWALNDAGVDVATYHDDEIYKAGSNGDFMDIFGLIIKAQMSHEESANKSRRSNAGWLKIHSAIEAGDKTAYSRQCPAWLDIADGKYVLNEHRAELVRQIFDWYVKGIGSLSIIAKLNAIGEKSWSIEKRYKDAKHWTPRYLHKLLTTPAVMGEYVTLKGETLSTDYYPQVIDADTFHKAQLVRKDRTTLGGNERKRAENLFSGIIKCGECGYSAVLQRRTFTSKSKPPRTYAYLRCNDARYKATACDNNAVISYAVIERTILDEMLPRIATGERGSDVLSAFDVQIAEAQRKLDVQQKQLDNIVDAIAEGIAAKPLAQKAATVEAEIETLTASIADLRKQRGMEAAKPARSEDTNAVEALRSQLESEDEEIRFEARTRTNISLRRLIHKIEIYANGTFSVWTGPQIWWHFDSKGEMMEGWELPHLPNNPY